MWKTPIKRHSQTDSEERQMKKGFGKTVETYGNIAFILVLLILGAVLVKKYFVNNSPRQPQHSHELQIGKRAYLPGVDWAASKRTLILALRPGCYYCKASAAFYQQLVRETNSEECRLLVVLPDTTFEGSQYLEDLGLGGLDVKNAAFKPAGIRVTPSLILADHMGAVQKVWNGELSPEAKADLLNRVQGNAETATGDISTEANPTRVKAIDAGKLFEMIRTNDKISVVDIRDREEYALSHISGAKNIPADELESRAARELKNAGTVVTYCGCLGMNGAASRILSNSDIQNVYMLEGSKDEWVRAGISMVSGK